MKKTILFLLLLSGCEFFQTRGEPVKHVAPYSFSPRQVAADQYELSIVGQPGVEIKTLKDAFRAKGVELCKGRLYLLRGMKEQCNETKNAYALHGLIDCVALDYFK